MLPKHSKIFTIMLTVCSFKIAHPQQPLVFNAPYSSSSQYVSYSGPVSSSVASGGTATAYSGTSYVSSGTAGTYSETDTSYVSSGTAAAYSETGTSYVSDSGSVVSSSGSQPALSVVSNAQLQPLIPPVPDPNVELFAHSLNQVLHSSPVLNAVPDFVIADGYSVVYNIASFLLQRQNVQDSSLAELTAKAGRDVGEITQDLYLNAMSHMLAKLLSLENVLTQETARTYPRIALSFVEDYGVRNGISDTESVLKTVDNGFLDFATSIGIYNISNLALSFQLFAQELKALAGGSKI